MTDIKSTLLKFQSIIALLVLCVVLTLLSDKFLTPRERMEYHASDFNQRLHIRRNDIGDTHQGH
ncbi:hypothetical protein NYZ99_12480 [Maribacter litopenaei]|uniref:Uncharacterized protein n=1 Tax=Maribacter litopenaei TaxID=2976127 RepID=A0ABY5Y539_9FLAO|nr:hypothetical protein NYZ99_12480 [Maribacter litopenaei]